MKWLHKIDLSNDTRNTCIEKSTQVTINKVYNSEDLKIPEEIDRLTQFFLTPIYLYNQQRLQISVSDALLADQLISKFLMYFEYVFKIYENKEISGLAFKNINQKFIDFFSQYIQDKFVDPITFDLYLKRAPIEHTTKTLEKYNIITDVYLSEYKNNNIFDHSIWELLNQTLLATDKEINITPIGWTLNDDLVHSDALAYFVTNANTVNLYVDKDSQVIECIQIF